MSSKDHNPLKYDISTLRDICLLIIGHMRNTSPSAHARFFDSMVEVVEATFRRGDLPAMRAIFRETYDGLEELPKSEQEELEEELAAYGISAKQILDSDREQLDTIIGRGRIETVGEYRLIADRVERIYADASSEAEVENLNKLLAAFEPDSQSCE